MPVSVYKRGLRWCSKCEKYRKSENHFCPICGRRLRTKDFAEKSSAPKQK